MAPTAIIVPVPEAEPTVDLLRRAHARDGARGMPAHLTLIYPFTDDAQLVAGRISEVRAIIGRFAGFDFELFDVRCFDNLPSESYLWLAPNPAQPFIEMIEALASAFPEHPPFEGAFSSIVPHLTVAASTDDGLLRHLATQLAEAVPITARVTTASIMEQVDGTWRLRAEIPLAAS